MGNVRTDNLFLLLDQLTSATLTNNLSNVSLQTRPVEPMLNSFNRLVLAEVSNQTPACNSREMKSLGDVWGIHNLRNLNRYPSCNRNPSISWLGPSRNMIYIPPKLGFLNLSNPVTPALIVTVVVSFWPSWDHATCLSSNQADAWHVAASKTSERVSSFNSNSKQL